MNSYQSSDDNITENGSAITSGDTLNTKDDRILQLEMQLYRAGNIINTLQQKLKQKNKETTNLKCLVRYHRNSKSNRKQAPNAFINYRLSVSSIVLIEKN